MPVKEKIINEFYIKTGSGMMKLENTAVEIEPRIITENEIKEIFNVPHEITLDMTVDKEKLLVIFGVYTEKQLQTNNWRKSHGMIMKRRKTIKK